MARPTPPNIARLKLPVESLVTSITADEDGRKLVFRHADGTFSVDINSLVETKPEMRRHTSSSRPKVEKRYFMPADKFSLVDFTDLGVVQEDTSNLPKFVVGENYALGGERVEGFETKYKLYNLVGMVDEFAGTKVDALIVKQIGGEEGNIYTISKNDCAFLGIEYQNGLQLFSKNLSWKHIRNVVEFDEHNLATSPTSEIDNTIRYIVLKLKGFTDYSDGYVLSPSGKLVKESQFSQSIQVTTKEPVVYGNGHIIQDKYPLRAFVTHPTSKLFNHGNFISSEDEVFILIELIENNNVYISSNSVDGSFGVDPRYFEGLDPNEYFEISWDELGCLTVDEYEKAKEQAAAEAARIAKEKEEEQKRLEAEAEKAAAENARLEALAIERMKKYQLKEPELREIPSFNNYASPIVGIEMYVSGIDKYLQDIEKTLDNISDDLTKFKINSPAFPKLDLWGNARRSGMISQNQLLNFLNEVF